ncbi:UNVERIFIED_CONTAM: hypothetical protein Scaly_1618500 [Sesamum calycinum]|uniref:Transposase-associated domain-containing protein n=1 Tax=Sesamum calycinum TaxID=2727403 RepID=A0AAW2PBK4_9LAMI
MYNKNLPGRATLTPKFEDGVKTFIEWAKGQRGHMDGDKIRCPCRKCKNTNFRTPDEDYFEAATVPPVSEERTLVVHVEAGPSYFAFSQDGVDDCTRSCPIDTSPSSYCYSSGLYDYDESGLADRFYNIVNTADHPLWNCCTQLQLILPLDHTLPEDYYNTKKLVNDLGLPVEKIDECASLLEGETHTGRSHCMLSLEEPRNVRLGLCTDGFALHDQCGHTCSCWPVIIIPYNLPPGVRTYDHATDKAFMVWAALMWTVNNLPAYAMVSG